VARRVKPAIEVVGHREFVRALRGLGGDAVKDIKKAHADVARIVENTAKPMAPTSAGGRSDISGTPYWQGGPSRSPGSLRGTVRSSGTQRGGFVRAGKKLVPWAGPVHFGWPSRPDASKGWRGGPIRPNPFLFDALDRRREEVADKFAGYIDGIRRNRGI
jgi:hypothetical protein